MNTEGKNKFNIIDILLLVIIVSAVGILVYVVTGNSLIKSSQNTTILYKIEIPIISNELLPEIRKLQEGNEILDSVRNHPIGSIYSVEIEDAYINQENHKTGVVERKIHPEHSRVVLTIKAKSQKEDVKYYVNGENIMVGVRINFRTQYLINSGNCIYLEEIDDVSAQGQGGK